MVTQAPILPNICFKQNSNRRFVKPFLSELAYPFNSVRFAMLHYLEMIQLSVAAHQHQYKLNRTMIRHNKSLLRLFNHSH